LETAGNIWDCVIRSDLAAQVLEFAEAVSSPVGSRAGNDTDYIQTSSKASKTHEIKMHLAQAL